MCNGQKKVLGPVTLIKADFTRGAELLRRSNEKRDERAKQALKDYMKKNYKVRPGSVTSRMLCAEASHNID